MRAQWKSIGTVVKPVCEVFAEGLSPTPDLEHHTPHPLTLNIGQVHKQLAIIDKWLFPEQSALQNRDTDYVPWLPLLLDELSHGEG